MELNLLSRKGSGGRGGTDGDIGEHSTWWPADSADSCIADPSSLSHVAT